MTRSLKKVLQFVTFLLVSVFCVVSLNACGVTQTLTQPTNTENPVQQIELTSPKLVYQLSFDDFEKDMASATKNWLANQQSKYGQQTVKKETFVSSDRRAYEVSVSWPGTKLIHVKMIMPNGYPTLLSFWLDENGEPKLQSAIECHSIAKTATGLKLQFQVTTKGPKTDEAYGLSLGEKKGERKIVIGDYQGLGNFPLTIDFKYPDSLVYLRDKKVEVEIFGSPTAGF